MTRKRKVSPMTPRSRRPSPKPVSSTPRRSFPLNPVLRSLSTPLRTRSHYPLLRALSTPIRRRSEYHPLVRRLCQEGAYERLPYDNDLYIAKTLHCERCHKTGTFTQNLAFKQGHAGEWVRACQTPGCGLVAYPAQPGTPPDQLARIEATREATALSSTMATPDSHTPRSSASFSGNYSQDLDVTPSSIGGQLEDWLSPLFWELDMESTDRVPATSTSASPDRVAGPSTGPAFPSLRNVPPQCARDEELARVLQSAVDKEDALLLQQLEQSPAREVSPAVSDHDEKRTTISSLSVELAAITGKQSQEAEGLLSPHSPKFNSPSGCTSRESSPSPRPRKKKRILVKPSPPLPRPKRKFYGPCPTSPRPRVRATAKVSTKTAKPAKSSAAILNNSWRAKPTNPGAESSTARQVPPQHANTHPTNIIVISSDDESAPPGGVDDDVIDITSSDSDIPPPATQPQGNGPPLATHPRRMLRRVGRLSARRPSPAARPRNDGLPPATHPRRDSPAPASQTRPPRRVGRLSAWRPPPATQLRNHSPPSVPQPRSDVAIESDVLNVTDGQSDHDGPPATTQRCSATSRAVVMSRVSLCDVEAYERLTRRVTESDSAPLLSQPRAVIRSRAPSREVEPPARSTYSNSANDSALSSAHPPTALQARTRSLPTIVNGLQDRIETGSSNKENDCPDVTQSCLDFHGSTRLSARQAAVRRRPGVFASLVQSSSSPSSSSSSSSSSPDELDDDASHVSDAVDRQLAEVPPGRENTVEQVDAAEVFGDPFWFEMYATIPELAMNVNPDTERRHWVLTVKIWYKNNMPPSTKMIPLEHVRCSIRLSDVFIVARTLHPTGYTHFRIWNQFTTDWETHSLHDVLAVSITDNHTLLIRLPTVATLSSWPENISQAYGTCQTVDPRREPSAKGKELAYY